MIIGNGNIAGVLKNRADVADGRLYFASGISNSCETRESEYEREKDLLLKQDFSSHIVYFSSLAVFEKDTRYFRHKREMETLVKSNFKTWTIIRIGNISWGNDNPHTIINFLRNKIKKGEPIEVRDEYKYIVDKKEFLYWINMIPSWSCEMGIPGERLKVSEIIVKYVDPRIHTK